MPPIVIERMQKKEASFRTQLYQELYLILRFKPPLDGFMCAMRGMRCLDIIRLDEMFKRSNSDYSENESMNDFVHRHYGNRAAELIDALI